MSQVVKRVYQNTKSTHTNEELMVETGFNQFSLSDFYIYNMGVDILEVNINNSPRAIYIAPDEYLTLPSYMEVYSCVTLTASDVKYGGLY